MKDVEDLKRDVREIFLERVENKTTQTPGNPDLNSSLTRMKLIEEQLMDNFWQTEVVKTVPKTN